MNPFGDHILGHALFHSIAYCFAVNSGRAVKGDDACSTTVGDGPCHRRDQIRSNNFAQMGFDFLKLDAVPEYFDLVIDAAEMMKYTAFILTRQVAGKIPGLAVDGRKPLSRQLRIVEIPLGDLATGDSELSFFSG